MRRRGGALMTFLYLVLFLSLVKRGAASNGCMSARRLAASSMTTERRSGAQWKEPNVPPAAFLRPANVDPLNPRAASGYCPSAQHRLTTRRRRTRRHTRLWGIHTSPLMTIEVDRVRADTRGCVSSIHFNNAGASLMPKVVADTYVEYVQQEELAGGYEVAATSEPCSHFYLP
mmetsp:Transcript_12965/g.45586  ORF Transcript_12965/g.45586 Transcript_12965/m.45586 type:complete len:173 (+) Transcript_12965:272-790(+)